MNLKRIASTGVAAVGTATLLPAVAVAQATGDTPVDPSTKIAEMGTGALALVGAIVAAIVIVGLAVLGIKGLTTAFKAIGKAMSSGT
jgi:TRAP-type mannitol/chloroaromatic compound transport system permease small subunit